MPTFGLFDGGGVVGSAPACGLKPWRIALASDRHRLKGIRPLVDSCRSPGVRTPARDDIGAPFGAASSPRRSSATIIPNNPHRPRPSLRGAGFGSAPACGLTPWRFALASASTLSGGRGLIDARRSPPLRGIRPGAAQSIAKRNRKRFGAVLCRDACRTPTAAVARFKIPGISFCKKCLRMRRRAVLPLAR
jgi:hypothetical protein